MEARRFILKASQVADGFAAGGIALPKSEFYATLPPASGKLPELLKGQDGKLDPTARAIFAILSSPCLLVRFLNFVAGSALALETRFFGSEGGQFVVLSRPDEEYWDMALLSDRDQVLALLDGLIGVSVLEDAGIDFTLDLPLAALAVLAAVAQLTRLAELRAALDDEAQGPELLFDPIPLQYVEATLQAEQKRPDLRSPVSLLGLASDGAIFDVLGGSGLASVMDDLRAAGLADDDGILTGDGLALVALLKTRISVSLLQFARRHEKGVATDALVLFHGHANLLMGAWRIGDEGRVSGLVLRGMGRTDMLGLLHRLLKHNDPGEGGVGPRGRHCLNCGTATGMEDRFCRECGHRLPADA